MNKSVTLFTMIAIIGAGISGLTLGYYLKKNGFEDFKIFEKNNIVGGKIQTVTYNNITLEKGPNSFMTTPLLSELLKELNLDEDIEKPDSTIVKNRFISKNDKITKLPNKPQQLLFSKIISISSKKKLFQELKRKPQKVIKNQTVTDFFTSHFGSEVVETLVKPFCRGIYASSSDDLLLTSCFPKLAEYQETYGSLIRGIKANKSLERREVIYLKNGLNSLCSKLYEKIKDNIYLNSEIENIVKNEKNHSLIVENKEYLFDKIVFCNEAKSLSALLKELLPRTSLALERVNYATLTATHSIYDKPQNEFPFQGFGVLYPENETNFVYGHIWNSSFRKSLPQEKTIITTMSALKDHKLIGDNLDIYFKNKFNLPLNKLEKRVYTNYNHAIPTYDIRHSEFLEVFKKENKNKLYICSNLINGVSIPDRIFESKKLALELIS